MKSANILIAHPDDDRKMDALLAVMKALDIKYEVSPYNQEFADMILQGDIDRQDGKGIKITREELRALWK